MQIQEHALCELIRNQQVFEFRYDGGMRWVEPHLLGYDSNDELTLLAWQRDGESGEGWRKFHVSKMDALSSTNETFPEPHLGYDPNDEALDHIVCRI